MSKIKKVIKKYVKAFLKNNKFVYKCLGFLLYLYLKIVYLSSNVQFILSNNFTKEKFLKLNGTIFTFWHNRSAFMFKVFESSNEEFNVLVSPHTDGRITKELLKKFKGKVIEGSTNKNPTIVIRQIIQSLSNNGNILLTPDGPRGPMYKINSTVTEIARRYNCPLIPISCMSSRYFTLKSWDKFIMPLPFGKIIIIIGEPINLSKNKEQNDQNLEYSLNQLTIRAEEMVRRK